MKNRLLPLGPSLTSVLWTVALAFEAGRLDAGSAVLVAIGLNLAATVSVFGLVLAGSRWSRRLGVVVLLGGLGVAAVRPADLLWWIGLGVTALSGMALCSPAVGASIRKLPAAAGPPGRAVLLALVLVSAPYVCGITTSPANAAVVTTAVTAPVVAFAFSRVVPGGLTLVRVVWPLGAVTLALFMPWPTAIVAVIAAVAVLILAWHPSTKVAFHPPREAGQNHPFPPGPAPRETCGAVEIDDVGGPK